MKRERCHQGAHCQSQKIQLHMTGQSPKHIKDSVNRNQWWYATPLLLKLWDALYSPVEARGDAGYAMGGGGGSNTDKVKWMVAEEWAHDKEAAQMKEQQDEECVIANQGAGDKKATKSEIRQVEGRSALWWCCGCSFPTQMLGSIPVVLDSDINKNFSKSGMMEGTVFVMLRLKKMVRRWNMWGVAMAERMRRVR